jgi:hypothetical protein
MTRFLVYKWQRALLCDSELNSTAKLVGLVLSTYADGQTGDSIYPARATIARACGFDVRTVDHAIERLEIAGGVTVTRTGGGTHEATNHYGLTYPDGRHRTTRTGGTVTGGTGPRAAQRAAQHHPIRENRKTAGDRGEGSARACEAATSGAQRLERGYGWEP